MDINKSILDYDLCTCTPLQLLFWYLLDLFYSLINNRRLWERPVLVLGSWMLLFKLWSNDFCWNIPFLVYSKQVFINFLCCFRRWNHVKTQKQSRLERLEILRYQNNCFQNTIQLLLWDLKKLQDLRNNNSNCHKNRCEQR